MESKESSIGFQAYWNILKRRWLPASAVFGSVFVLTALGLLLQKPTYVAEGKLLFRKISSASSLTGLGRGIGELTPLQELSNPLDTEAEVIRSAPVIQKTIRRLDLEEKDGDPLKIKHFLEQLKVSNVKGTNVLQVAYRDKNPKKAAGVVNTLMAVYLENDVLTNRAEAVAARQFIQRQLPKAEANLLKADVELRRFKEQNQVVDLAAEAKSAVEVIASLQKQVNGTQTELADAQAQSSLLKNQLNRDLQQASSATSISQLPAVQDVLKQVQQIEAQLATERSRFQEDHPSVVSLKNKQADLERLLQTRVKQGFGVQKPTSDGTLQNSQFEQKLTEDFVKSEARRLGLANQLAALSNVQNTYRQRLNALPRLEQKQRELERQLQASQATYAILLQKFQEIQITENQNLGNARIISAAMLPEDPVGSRKLSYLAAALLGLLASGATVYVLEATDKSIKTVEEARKVFGFTVLGLIPFFKKPEKNTTLRDLDLERSIPELIVKDYPRSPFSLAYRMLQANLKFLNSDKQLKVIVVTSSVPKEGKSTVCANLAVAMAQLGRKVLLVDGDMHRPMQHQIWDLPNDLGLSNLIVGQTELRTAIKKVMVNLHVLNSGVIPPNPMALLDSQRMASLIEIFSANYDFTIIDAPSLNVAAEAPILGKMADGVLFVVRPGVVDCASAAYAKEFLAQSGQKVLGQVINGVIPNNEPHSYYYFSQSDEAEASTTVDDRLAMEVATTKNT